MTLTAANPEVADSELPSYPAVVNHVVYFGDGVSRKTVLRGFKIDGARAFTTGSGEKSPIESDDIRKTPFFYADGGGLKVYARSYPTIEHVEITGTTRARAAPACRLNISDRCRSRCSSAIASSAATARR